MQVDPSIFKAYDIRGIFPNQLNEKVAYAIGKAYAQFLKSKNKTKNNLKVVVGRDVRISGEKLQNALIVGLQSEGIDISVIGIITTEQIYFADAYYNFDGAIIVSASHNPAEYNGFKLCRENAIPISGDSGINEIQKYCEDIIPPSFIMKSKKVKSLEIINEYLNHLKKYFIKGKIRHFSIVANCNFGTQGQVLKTLIEKYDLPVDVKYLNEIPNGEFPKGRPDPMIPSNRKETSDLVKAGNYDFAVAWDADADRCFFYDENGVFINAYYINVLFIDFVMQINNKYKVLHDPRLRFAVKEIVDKHHGKIIFNKSGHAFIKERMRKDDIYYGAEITAHNFFKEYFYADSGLIPFLWLMQILTKNNSNLSSLIDGIKNKFPASDEMLYKTNDIERVLNDLAILYKNGKKDEIDGISLEFKNWRFNARGSNTEPLLKVNLEAKSKKELIDKTRELNNNIISLGARRIME